MCRWRGRERSGLFKPVHVASCFSIISWFISFGIYSAIATYIPGSAEMYGQVRYSTVCHGGGGVWRGLFQPVHVASWFSIISWFMFFGIYSAVAQAPQKCVARYMLDSPWCGKKKKGGGELCLTFLFEQHFWSDVFQESLQAECTKITEMDSLLLRKYKGMRSIFS